MPSAKKTLQQLLRKGELESAIGMYCDLSQQYGHADDHATAIQLSGSYRLLLRQEHDQVISGEDFRLEHNKINRAMLNMVKSVPDTWVISSQPTRMAPDDAPNTSSGGVFSKKWLLAAGLALLVGIGGWGAYQLFSPQKTTATTSPQVNQPTHAPTPHTAPDPAVTPAANPPETTTSPATQPSPNKPKTVLPRPTTTQPTTTEQTRQPTLIKSKETHFSLTTPDQRFRSFGKTVIRDDMERGMVGEKLAFRNVRTNKILPGRYTDAEDFSGGKAYVSEDGVNYFYIDKNGQRIQG
jgi:hypothetical protein